MRGGVRLLTVLGCLVTAAVAYRCERMPEVTKASKTPADNRFQLKVSGAPDKYVPGEGYTISLEGQKNPGHGQVAQKFIGFSLVVEPQNFTPLRVMTARDITPRPIGTFTLYGDSMTKFSPSCPNMVTHTSTMPKTEVQIRWTAPPPGSGCVIFRATVIEHRDVWYQDDGPLTKMLCEEVQENLDTQPDVIDNCCACDEAKYEVTFEGLWSRHTHPKDFPSNSWLTRFSDIIGASHSPHYKFWEYGGFATEGLRQVSERGSTRMLESELKSHSSEIRTIIKARGISYPNVTGKTFAVFRVNRHHHLMSLVSMIDPSPDWIVGVSALELCVSNCTWVESKILNLYPWDAGTDSGITYISPDQQTFPREKIRRITSSFPNDPRSPFYDPSGLEMKPLARLYLTRQRLYEKTCDEELGPNNGCGVTEWTAWGPCSQTCGQGVQYRRRDVRRPGKNCPTYRLNDSRNCVVRHCRPLPQSPQDPQEESHCEKKEWTDWSRCEPRDSSCKEGVQRRYRFVIPKVNRKYCTKVPSEEERPCTLSMPLSTCPKNYRGKVFVKDPQSSTCCEENNNDNGRDDEQEILYGAEENNETTDQEFPDENGADENGVDENANDENENGGETGNGDGGEENREGEEGNEREENYGENGEKEDNFNQEVNGEGEEEENGNENGGEEIGQGNDEGEENYEGNGEGNDVGAEENGEGNDVGGEGNGEETEYNGNHDDDDGGDNNEMPEEPTGQCSMRQWSRWSACSVTCGVGVRQRSRQLLSSLKSPRLAYQRAPPPPPPPPAEDDYGTYDDETEAEAYAEEPCNMYKILEMEPCNGTYYSCQFSPDDAREEGDEQTTTEESMTGDRDLEALGQTRDQTGAFFAGTERPVRNCKFSRWSEWSECDAPCNQPGFKVRTRHIEVHAKNGGKSCTGKTRKQKRCFRRCKDDGEGEDGEREENARNHGRCRYEEWSSWTECTATCGLTSVRQRTRQVVFGNPAECEDRVRKQRCNVGPCPH